MNPAIPDDVDTQLSRYLDAEEIGKAGINPAVIKQKKVTYNKQRGVNEMFMPLPSGGYTKIGEERVVDPVPPQDVGKPPPDQVFDQATASWQQPAAVDRTAEIQAFRAEMPRAYEDYLAAGFTEPELQAAGVAPPLPPSAARPQMTPEQVAAAATGTIEPQDLTIREGHTDVLRQIFESVGADQFFARQLAESIVGNPASTRDLGIGLADLTPLGAVYGGQEGYQTFSRGWESGDNVTAALGALEAGLSVLEAIPLTAAGGRAMRQAIPGIRQTIEELGQEAQQRIAREGSTLYSNPVGPVVDRALAAAGRLAGGGEGGRVLTGGEILDLPDDAMVTLYHGTTKAGAENIEKTGVLRSAGEPAVYLTTDPKGGGYGDGTVVKVQIPRKLLEIDDEFPSGRADFRIDVGKPGGNVPVTFAGRLAGGGEAVQAPSLGGLPGRISTRFPTAAKATEDPYTGELVIGYDELKQDPKVYEFNVNITRDYPNMRPQPNATTDETAEQFITHVKDNLLYLHDQVPAATRKRSQLWYDGARNITDRWSQEYGVPDTSIAGALAALSPQKDWYQNVSLAQRVLDVVKPKSGTPAAFTREMEQTFRNIPSLNKPQYEPLLDVIRGKSYDQITDPDPAVQNTLRALFVRLHDQTYTSPDYRIVSPEGDFLDVATNLDGSPSRVAWGSLNEIGKAIGAIEANGDVRTISGLMGERHKVRNFYNNIYDPNSPYGDVTIDTHAVAAGLLRPLSGNSLEVDHNFKNTTVAGRGTTKGSSVSGVSGNYGLYAEAYRRAAQERGILPRQMQSITWEAVRGLFPDTFKTERNAEIIDGIWNRYRNGEIEIDEARRIVSEAAGGINPPTWQQ